MEDYSVNKITKLTALILCLIMLIPMTVLGYAGSVEQNSDVSMPKASPVVDGIIETNGAWSAPAYITDATVGRFWDINAPTSTAEVYFAYDDSGLYFAADVVDCDDTNGFVPSTGYDNIDNSGSKKPYGFNGDVMNLMLDPLGVFEKNSSKQTTPWYNVGIFTDNTVKVYRSQVNEQDITSSVSAKGSITSYGWRFEVMIPWSVITADVSALGLSAAQAKLATVGSVSRAACMYMDRYYTESGSVSTWGRFITVCEKTHDGYNGAHTSGVVAKAYGLVLDHSNLHEHIWGDWSVVTPATCIDDGVNTRSCTLCGFSETAEIFAPGHTDGEETRVEPTCTEKGKATVYCSVCSMPCDSYDIPAKGHSYGDWYTVTETGETTHGLMRRDCKECDAYENKLIPATAAPAVLLDNYTMSVTLADEIKDMRYAPGVYEKPSEIKVAEGNVAIDNATVVKGTVDGVYSYEMPTVGTYTLWIRMKNGSEFILPVEIKDIESYLTAYGVKLTVNDFKPDLKDFFIAKGEYDTYSEIKAAGYIVNVTSAKVAGRHDYSYTVYEDGVHTVLVRYNDGSYDALHIELTVDKPVFTENGLQVIVSNLPDVKVIRTAYGTWDTVKELKATDTIRNFSAKTAIKGKDPYTIQYRNEGAVTVIVEYNNGYVAKHHYNVQKRVPTFNITEKTVTVGNLTGLSVVRYAPGEYATSTEIKNAPGSQYIRPAQAVNGVITVELENGTYSFCVQYNDESFYYKTVTISDEIVATATVANVSAAFSSNMMLQRDKPISVWGWSTAANEGKIVTATLGDMTGYAVIKNKEWKITFPNTLPASTEPLMLTVNTAKATKNFRNILIGDVYYVIGQSNVFYGMANQVQEMNANKLSLEVDYNDSRNMRFFRASSTYTSSYTGSDAQGTTTLMQDVPDDSKWLTASGIQSQVTNPPATGSFSALGYLFAYNMSNKTDIPIGVIEIDASGFPLIAFAPNELADKWGDDTLNELTGVHTYNLNNGYLTNPSMPTRFAYNHLIYPIKDFCTAGIIWYQGESDCNNTTEIWGENADTFSYQFTELMTYFRNNFGNSDFPVYMIEFPTCYYNGGANAFIDMGGVQCEQGLISNMLSDFHLINSSDMFDNTTWYNSLHPYIKDKQAQRLASIVAADNYGIGNISYVSGPVYQSASYSGTKVTVTFKNVGSGLKAYSGRYVDGFDVYVNIGGTYQWIEVNDAYVQGSNQVVVPSSYTILGVRYNRNTEYLFPSNGINLCNSNNVPASAFIDLK